MTPSNIIKIQIDPKFVEENLKVIPMDMVMKMI